MTNDYRQESYELIIATTFDSSLFDYEDKSYQLAISTIHWLKSQKIPLIAVTNKTDAEIENLRSLFNLNDPLVVECGSAILIPQNSDRFNVTEISIEGKHYLKQLGRTHIEARAALKVIQSTVRINNLRGFGDLSETEIRSLTGLSIKEVKQAKAREFSEMFLTPDDVDSQKIVAAAEEFGFQALIGDSLSCLIGAEASVKEAINWLKNNYRTLESDRTVVTVGLGNSSDDLEMLEAVDIPFVVASNREVAPDLAEQKWRTTEATGLAGWVEAINTLCRVQGTPP